MDKMKTGTTTLGIVCKDGIVIAADKRTTAGGFVVRKEADKITQIADNVAITTAGTVSDIQMVIKLLKAELKLKGLRVGRDMTVKEVANYTSRVAYENARQYFPSIAQILVAGYDSKGIHLFVVDVDGALLSIDDYFSTGSGSPLVFGILEHAYKDSITTKEAEDLAVKAISASAQRDTYSGNGVDVVTITKGSLRKSVQKKIVVTQVDR